MRCLPGRADFIIFSNHFLRHAAAASLFVCRPHNDLGSALLAVRTMQNNIAKLIVAGKWPHSTISVEMVSTLAIDFELDILLFTVHRDIKV
jgi:hypothetical protein